jgi:hypothetical protein
MTPDEEREFIRLWTAGTATAAIAQQLGIPVGTVQSRAHRLQQQGKIQSRPRGGARQRGTAAENHQKSQVAVDDGSPPASTRAYATRPHPRGTRDHLHGRP